MIHPRVLSAGSNCVMETRVFYRFLKLSNRHWIKPLVFLTLKNGLLNRMDQELTDAEILALLRKRQAGMSQRQIGQELDEYAEYRHQEPSRLLQTLATLQENSYQPSASQTMKATNCLIDQYVGSLDPELGTLIKRVSTTTTLPIFHGPDGLTYLNQSITLSWEYWSHVLSLRVTTHYSLIHPCLPDQYRWTCCNYRYKYHPPGRCSVHPHHLIKST
jgi:hypothetical protein